MKRNVSLWMTSLTLCCLIGGTASTFAQDGALDTPFPLPEISPAESFPPPDAAPAPDAVPASDMAPAPDVAPAPDAAPTPDSAPVPDMAPAPDATPSPDTAPDGSSPDVTPTAPTESAPPPAEGEPAPSEQEKPAPKKKKKPKSDAKDGNTTRKVTRTREKSKLEEFGTSLIFSADVGMLTAFPSTKLKDYGPKFGLSIEAKALGSVLLEQFIIDGGLGWYFYNVSGKEPRRINGIIPVTDNDVALFVDETGIKLSGTVFEIAGGYRFKGNFFAGPVVQMRYPSDLSYDSAIIRDGVGLLIGAQGGYQIFDPDLNTRFVGRTLMSVNDINWLAFHFMLGLQVGLPFTQPEVLTIRETTTKTQEKRIVEYRKQEYKVQITQDVVKLLLDNTIVFFDAPGYPTLTTESQSFLLELAQSLGTSEGEWGKLKIDTVSRDHAQVIRDALVSAGLPEDKVALGKKIPGPKSANPPVEFGFYDVKQPENLVEAVRGSMKSANIPETCEGGTCQ